MINTSFNVRGEPIVCTPEDAYRCFMATNMDVLVIEDFVLHKEEQPNFRRGARRIPGQVSARLRGPDHGDHRNQPGPEERRAAPVRARSSCCSSAWSAPALVQGRAPRRRPRDMGGGRDGPLVISPSAAPATALPGLDVRRLSDRLGDFPCGAGLVFYPVFTPIGLLMRLVGRDPLRRDFQRPARATGPTATRLPRRAISGSSEPPTGVRQMVGKHDDRDRTRGRTNSPARPRPLRWASSASSGIS